MSTNYHLADLHAYVIPVTPKMLRETLCVAQQRIHAVDDPRNIEHSARLQRLIDEIDQMRPLGPDGKHNNRHTPTCGCPDPKDGPRG